MAFDYILQSKKNNRYYIGSTLNLKRRLEEHNSGKSTYTRNLRPLDLVFYQEYPNIIMARKIEYKLKSFKRKDIIEKIIEDGQIKTKDI